MFQQMRHFVDAIGILHHEVGRQVLVHTYQAADVYLVIFTCWDVWT